MKAKFLYIFLILIWPLALAAKLDNTATRNQPVYLPESQSNFEFFAVMTDTVGIDAVNQAQQGYIGAGHAWGDFNNDGRADLYVTGTSEGNILYFNSGNGSFAIPRSAPSAAADGALSGGAVWGDFDNDGWSDLYVLNNGANILLRNNEASEFLDVTENAGIGDIGKAMAAAWGDYDRDGFLDLYIANGSCAPACDPVDNTLSADRLYHNNRNGTFTDVSDLLTYDKRIGSALGVSFVDYDGDGDSDIYLVNDSSSHQIGNVLWRNDGRGCTGWCWHDASEETNTNLTVVADSGFTIGDYDNDLDLDMYFGDPANAAVLLQNQGDGTFANMAELNGLNADFNNELARGASFIDYDNDGWLDLVVATSKFIPQDDNLMAESLDIAAPRTLYHNNGDGTFGNVTPPSWLQNPSPSVSVTVSDYNDDGLPDMMTGDWNEGYTLYRNEGLVGADGNWLTIRLKGGGAVNSDAIGARVYVTTEDNRTRMRTVTSSSSLGSSSDKALHFGLGSVPIREARVVWPNGSTNVYKDVPVNQVWQLSFPSGGQTSMAGRGWLIVALAAIMLLGLSLPVWRRSLTPDGLFGKPGAALNAPTEASDTENET